MNSSRVSLRSLKSWRARIHRSVVPANVPWIGHTSLLGRFGLFLVADRVNKVGMTRIRQRTPRLPWSPWWTRRKRINMTLRSINHPSKVEKVNMSGVKHRYLSALPLSRLTYSKSPWRIIKCQYASTMSKQILRTTYLLMKDTCCYKPTRALSGVKCSLPLCLA